MLIANFLYGILSMVPELLRVVAAIIVAVIKGVCQIIREGSWIVVEAVVDLVDAVFDAFIEAVAGIVEMIPVIGGDISNEIRKAKDWVVPALEDDTNELANKFVDTFTGTVDGRSGEISQTMEDGLTTGGDIIALSDENGALSADSFLQSYGGADWAGTGDMSMETLMGSMENAYDTSVILQDSNAYGAAVPENIKNGIAENSDVPAEAVNEMIEKAKTSLDKFPQDSEEAGRKVPESLRSGINSKASVVKSAANTLKTNVQSPLKNINMTSVGHAIPEGMANGMSARAYLVRNKAQELSNMIPDTIKKLLYINSPSKVIAAITESVPEGAAVGIDRSMHFVYSSVSDMADVITDGLSDTIKKVSDYVESDMDLAPTITPVLDLSAIQNGTAYANKMLSGLTANVNASGSFADVSTPSRYRNEMIQDALNGAMTDISNNIYGKLNDNTNYTIEVPINLDGREVARVTAPYTRNEINRLNRNDNRRGGTL
jgi:phage-related protein